ncbi:hypothetical protein EON65_15710 [archaeon]|nr:MAG: hypothetical protein EON65_15710 [archaeon]
MELVELFSVIMMQVAHGIIILKEQPCSLEIDLARQYDKTIVTGLDGTNIKVILDSDAVPEEDIKYIQEGSTVSIDGHTGNLFRGVVPTIDPLHNRDFQNIMHWTEKYKGALVKCFATSYDEVERAVGLGAEGVGLFSLDALVMSKECIGHFQKLVLSEDGQERNFASRDLEELMRKNIFNLYGLMQSKKVVLRLLIGPLSKFFPNPSDRSFDHNVGEIASSAGVDESRVRSFCTQVHESNPVMGCKGGRLEIVRQDLARLQARAITGKERSPNLLHDFG